ncbi:hypothetical protein PVAP13_3KG067300 [Panicum virgatum]|uniref:Uncharacterized protein n=1 Tax=Panicum virgatum TaxID=38727 RepID=A0A8T0UFZ1_PANVG|nr:hypothetical protein PVAP13_3KG067300 [Panicum virgatum]
MAWRYIKMGMCGTSAANCREEEELETTAAAVALGLGNKRRWRGSVFGYALKNRKREEISGASSLTLSGVTVAVPLVPGEWCPLLERLRIEDCRVERRAVVVLLPRLKLLAMEDVDVGSTDREDAPELEESRSAARPAGPWTTGPSPCARLRWREQFAQCVRVDVGDQGSVSEGTIEFTANGDRNDMSCCEMKLFRAQMMKMLRGLLPDLTPSTIADVARPYMTLDVSTMVDEETGGEVIQEEKLTCDIGGLMSRST